MGAEWGMESCEAPFIGRKVGACDSVGVRLGAGKLFGRPYGPSGGS